MVLGTSFWICLSVFLLLAAFLCSFFACVIFLLVLAFLQCCFSSLSCLSFCGVLSYFFLAGGCLSSLEFVLLFLLVVVFSPSFRPSVGFVRSLQHLLCSIEKGVKNGRVLFTWCTWGCLLRWKKHLSHVCAPCGRYFFAWFEMESGPVDSGPWMIFLLFLEEEL